VTFSGSTFQRLFISESYIDCTGVGNSALVMTNTGTSGGTKSTITSRNTDWENNTATAATIVVSAGRIFGSGASPDVGNNAGPSLKIDGASAAGPYVSFSNTSFTGQIQVTDNTAILVLSFYSITSGSSSGIDTPATPSTGYILIGTGGINSSATNAITGSGVVVPGGENAMLGSSGGIVSTVTQSVFAKMPEGQTLLGAGATNVTHSMLVLKGTDTVGAHITSQQVTAPTVAAANSGTSPTVTLSNATDTAGRINYTTGSGSPTTGATVTVTFKKAYATAPIVVLTPQNTNAGVNAPQIYVTTTTTTFVIHVNVAPAASTAYNWFYQVIETQ